MYPHNNRHYIIIDVGVLVGVVIAQHICVKRRPNAIHVYTRNTVRKHLHIQQAYFNGQLDALHLCRYIHDVDLEATRRV